MANKTGGVTGRVNIKVTKTPKTPTYAKAASGGGGGEVPTTGQLWPRGK